MALVYRGQEVRSEGTVVDTVDSGVKGTYRGSSVEFHKTSKFNRRSTPVTRHYRGITY